MLKSNLRENMKSISRFLVFALALVSVDAFGTPVSTTAGSNLTAYNQTSGAVNNANWNTLMNNRTSAGSSAPVADFGNCNSLILRCAQPKCSSGGCTTMDVARPIVAGCVESNASCKQYGDDLIEYISAQIVASSTAKSNQQAADAQVAAAQAAAAQSAQQLQQMQSQMQQMQAQMQQQNAETTAQLQAALEEQKQLTAQAIAQANSAQQSASAATTSATTTTASSGALTQAQAAAASSGVSADVLARQQISGEILTEIENAEVSLKEIRAVLLDVYDYAGCDSSGNNCTGPKRVKTFKQKAMNFFDPYNNVLSELYDALILAQSVGVDITDIYMMLNGTCNVWGKYLCGPGQVMHYTSTNCINNISVPSANNGEGSVLGGASCKIGQVVPMSDGGCQLIEMLTSEDEVKSAWLDPETGTDDKTQVRVGCASEALENSMLFSNMKKQSSIDIETLQRIIEQDAPSVYGGSVFGSSKTTPEQDGLKYCALNAETYADLQKLVSLKQLPKSVCVSERDLNKNAGMDAAGLINATDSISLKNAFTICQGQSFKNDEFNIKKCLCEQASRIDSLAYWDSNTQKCVCAGIYNTQYEFNDGTLTCEEK